MDVNTEVLSPKSYRPVRLRHVMPVDLEKRSIRVAFTLSHGTIFGLDLELESARVLSGLLEEQIKRYWASARERDFAELDRCIEAFEKSED